MTELLKGAPVAAAISEELISRAAMLKQTGMIPTLSILRVGERSDLISYETGAINDVKRLESSSNSFISRSITRGRYCSTRFGT